MNGVEKVLGRSGVAPELASRVAWQLVQCDVMDGRNLSEIWFEKKKKKKKNAEGHNKRRCAVWTTTDCVTEYGGGTRAQQQT